MRPSLRGSPPPGPLLPRCLGPPSSGRAGASQGTGMPGFPQLGEGWGVCVLGHPNTQVPQL